MAVATAWVFLVPATVEWRVGEFLYKLRSLDEFFSTTRQFADVTCTAVIIAIILIYRRRDQAVVVPLVVALLLSGAATTIVKGAVGRSRPEYSVTIDTKRQVRMENYAAMYPDLGLRIGEHQILGLSPALAWVERAQRTGTWDTEEFVSGFDSFPSGHSNHAWVLAAFLCLLWPRAWWVWIILAAGCSLSRVRYERHFFTDVVAGGAFGWVFAHWVMSWRWPMVLGRRWFGEASAAPEPADKAGEPAPAAQPSPRSF